MSLKWIYKGSSSFVEDIKIVILDEMCNDGRYCSQKTHPAEESGTFTLLTAIKMTSYIVARTMLTEFLFIK